MASNYPTSLDDFTDYVDGTTIMQADTLNNMQKAIEELQVKVGIDSSAVTSSHDYKLANLPKLGSYTAPTPSSGYGPGNAVTALTDGFVVAYATAGSNGDADLRGYVGGVLRTRDGGNDKREGAFASFPVKAGDSWYVVGSGEISSATIKWVSLS